MFHTIMNFLYYIGYTVFTVLAVVSAYNMVMSFIHWGFDEPAMHWYTVAFVIWSGYLCFILGLYIQIVPTMLVVLIFCLLFNQLWIMALDRREERRYAEDNIIQSKQKENQR